MDDVFVIQCPDCESTLKVDRETGAVLAHEPAVVKRKLGSLEEAAAENTRRTERAADLFAASFEREEAQERDPREDLPRGAREGPEGPDDASAQPVRRRLIRNVRRPGDRLRRACL